MHYLKESEFFKFEESANLFISVFHLVRQALPNIIHSHLWTESDGNIVYINIQ